MHELVFLSPMGFRWDEHNLDKLWRETQRASGIRKVRLHDLRHTFASQLIEHVEHCGGGNGPNTMDMLTPLMAWVEKGTAPERINAT